MAPWPTETSPTRRALSDGRASKFVRLHGFESRARRAWLDYQRAMFALACAFDCRSIVCTLVTEFGVNTRVRETPMSAQCQTPVQGILGKKKLD